MENIILLAARFARLRHAGQVRKYTGVPYITHPARVAGRAAIHELATVDMVVAALLHDILEDTDTQDWELGIFSPRVLGLVKELTNPSKNSTESRAIRKQQDREYLATISDQGNVLKLLDRIDNLRDLAGAPSDFLQLYLEESEKLVEVIGDVDPELKQELVALIESMK